MPDWCENKMTLKKEDAEKYLFVMKPDEEGNEKQIVDFNKLIPMPESLNVTKGGTNNRDIYTYLSDKNNKTVSGILAENNIEDLKKMLCGFESVDKILFRAEDDFQRLSKEDIPKSYQDGKQLVDNFKEYGVTTWYDWQRQNWGTKWNACESHIEECGDDVIVQFGTAWCPPVGILEELAKHADFINVSHVGNEQGVDVIEGKNGNVRRIPECMYELQGSYRAVFAPETECTPELFEKLFSKAGNENLEVYFTDMTAEEDKVIAFFQVKAKKEEYEVLWAVEDVANDVYDSLCDVISESEAEDLNLMEVEIPMADYFVKSLTENELHPEQTGDFHFKKGMFEITASAEMTLPKEDFQAIMEFIKNSDMPEEQREAWNEKNLNIIEHGDFVSVRSTKTDTYCSFSQDYAESDALFQAKFAGPGMYSIPLDESVNMEHMEFHHTIDNVKIIEPAIHQKSSESEKKKEDVINKE